MRKAVIFLFGLMIVGAVTQPAAAKPGPRIALLDSANAGTFFGAHYPGCDPTGAGGSKSYYLGAQEYERYFRGWQLMLDQMPSDYDYSIIHDEDLTASGLAPYQVLILSNDPLFTDAQTRAIHQWVLKGGRLLATFGTGYKDTVTDTRQIDGWKLQKGGTFGLHQLWHDPVGKLFSTLWVDPGVDVRITRYDGPTKPLEGALDDDVLPYGAEANILVRRPENHPGVLGYLMIESPGWKAPSPAIISTRQSKGLVVYLAFAPEYIVYKELESRNLLPAGYPRCPDGQNWEGRALKPLKLMTAALDYLLAN